jgi:hypothetical protein
MIKSNSKSKSLLAAAILLFTVIGFYPINSQAGHGGGHGGGGHIGGGGHGGGGHGGHDGVRSHGNWHNNGHGHGHYHGGRGRYWHGGYGYWDSGSWFWNGVAVALVAGTVIATLPPVYKTVYVQNVPYYYADNICYQPTSDGYIVVNCPA